MKKYLLTIAVVVLMAFTLIATTPALAAGPSSAPTTQQLIAQLKNTHTASEGYALWNSFTAAQRAAVGALVSPTSATVTLSKTSSSGAVSQMTSGTVAPMTSGVVPLTIGEYSYTLTITCRDAVGLLWTFSVWEDIQYDGVHILAASQPLLTGRIYRTLPVCHTYVGGWYTAYYFLGKMQYKVNANADFAFGIPTPWGMIVVGHKYPWMNITYLPRYAAPTWTWGIGDKTGP